MADQRYAESLARLELSELLAERAKIKASVERLQGNQKIVSMKTGGLLAGKRAKLNALASAIAVRQNGLDNMSWKPNVGDKIEILGSLHGHSDFSSVQTVTEVGVSIVRTTNGWNFFCRHDGWVNGQGMVMRDCPHLNQ